MTFLTAKAHKGAQRNFIFRFPFVRLRAPWRFAFVLDT